MTFFSLLLKTRMASIIFTYFIRKKIEKCYFISVNQKKKTFHFQSTKYESNEADGCCACFRACGNGREFNAKNKHRMKLLTHHI
jgi:hypothetical protein